MNNKKTKQNTVAAEATKYCRQHHKLLNQIQCLINERVDINNPRKNLVQMAGDTADPTISFKARRFWKAALKSSRSWPSHRD